MKPIAESMTTEECWRRIGISGVGRIGFDAGSGPRIHPVNYTCDGSKINLLTDETSELARFTRLFAAGGLVTFEVDQVDESRGECWSVLVTAFVDIAGHQGPDDPGLRPSPAPGGERDWWVRLRPRQITGRRLGGSTPGTQGRPSPTPAPPGVH